MESDKCEKSFANTTDLHPRTYARGELSGVDKIRYIVALPWSAIKAVSEAGEEAGPSGRARRRGRKQG